MGRTPAWSRETTPYGLPGIAQPHPSALADVRPAPKFRHMDILAKVHKHYGTTILLLVLIGAILALAKGPKVAYQRVVAVLVDINVVVGLASWWVSGKALSLLHPLLALAAVGLLHASAKSDQSRKVATCWLLAFAALILAWMTNASWGPGFLKGIWMVSLRGGAPA